MELSIIIPTYNEVENIKILVPLINKSLAGLSHEIIIVDDNSPDGTGKIAEELSKSFPLKTIHRKCKSGLATAVLEAFRASTGNFLCVMDADLSHPPEEIINLLERLKEEDADIVVASRLVEGGKISKWPVCRKIISFCARSLAYPLTKVKDPLSGFFVINKNVINNVRLSPLGYKILLEILVKGNYKKAVEHPFTFKDRVHGKTKLDKKTIFYYLKHVLNLYRYKFTLKNEKFS